ncbi:MAG: hypothetical protein ABW157_09965 [Candidatus Thiodiazotropha sp. LLP2]
MGRMLPHRGFADEPGSFAERFVLDRMDGFKKDMHICLTPSPLKTQSSPTHAYFPALAACCGTLEYLTAMYTGRGGSKGWRQVAIFAEKYLPQPDYNQDTIRVLMQAFRNSVAHQGIATGIWIDRNPQYLGRRITWRVLANSSRPAINIIQEEGIIKYDPPWHCKYSHRVHIHLKSLGFDIRNAAREYANDVSVSEELQKKFFKLMRQLYPN